MDLRLSPDLVAFRDEVRTFLRDEMAPASTRGHADPRDLTGLDDTFERAHQQRCGERGYLGISLPETVGGGGRSPSHKAIWAFESAYADAPSVDTAVTLAAGPIVGYGTPEQQERHLPLMLRGETLWCIAYSEKAAGSDLSAIETLAIPEDDGSFVLAGDKALVTGSHKADWCLTIARTDIDAPARDALSMFIVDMRAEGVVATRRQTANGWTLGEITFDDVKVGPEGLLGALHGGWRQLAGALVEERSAAAHLGWATRVLDELVTWSTTIGPDRSRPADDVRVRDTLAQLRTELSVGYRLAERVMAEANAGTPGASSAAASKVWATELLQRIAARSIEMVGVEALAWSPLFSDEPPDVPLRGRIAWETLERIHPTISVGANELQRDTIARAEFGPRSAVASAASAAAATGPTSRTTGKRPA
jgi:alkylation response protein AidB-like acyl-CoA dehydrogenase